MGNIEVPREEAENALKNALHIIEMHNRGVLRKELAKEIEEACPTKKLTQNLCDHCKRSVDIILRRSE
jgi:cell division FtsZ-interacting protein ZapD